MATSSVEQIAIIGFGEAGGIFAEDIARQGASVRVFDILLKSKQHRRGMLSRAKACGVEAADDLEHCICEAQIVISAVTASSSLAVAKEAAKSLRTGQIFLDINAVSPQTKRLAARYIAKSKAHFVESAVMAPVPPQRLKVPMLLGGPHAAEAGACLQALGMNARALSDEIGVASAVKMCRSVVMKGLEALAIECLFAARKYRAEEAVLESLAASYPGMGWDDDLPDYLVSRVAEHGRRRAAEMRQVAEALREVGVEPRMALATAHRHQQFVNQMAAKDLAFQDARPFSWKRLADALGRGARAGTRRKRR